MASGTRYTDKPWMSLSATERKPRRCAKRLSGERSPRLHGELERLRFLFYGDIDVRVARAEDEVVQGMPGGVPAFFGGVHLEAEDAMRDVADMLDGLGRLSGEYVAEQERLVH